MMSEAITDYGAASAPDGLNMSTSRANRAMGPERV